MGIGLKLEEYLLADVKGVLSAVTIRLLLEAILGARELCLSRSVWAVQSSSSAVAVSGNVELR